MLLSIIQDESRSIAIYWILFHILNTQYIVRNHELHNIYLDEDGHVILLAFTKKNGYYRHPILIHFY